MDSATQKKPVKFCSHCGKQMSAYPRPADECFMFYGDVSTIPVAPRYDRNTGKRNYVYMYECPDYEKRRFIPIQSPHDSYFLERVFNLE